jgi:phi13 family phage major tail protein
MAKKIVVNGLNKLYYAVMTDEETETYSAVKYFPGLREITVSPKEENASIYAENVQWDIDSALGDIEISLDITDIPPDIIAEVLGKKKATGGGYIDNANDVKPYIALLFDKTLSGGLTEYVILYKGKFNIFEDKAKTKEGKPEYQSKTMTGKFLPLSNGMWKYAVRSNDSEFDATTWATKWGKEVVKATVKVTT